MSAITSEHNHFSPLHIEDNQPGKEPMYLIYEIDNGTDYDIVLCHKMDSKTLAIPYPGHIAIIGTGVKHLPKVAGCEIQKLNLRCLAGKIIEVADVLSSKPCLSTGGWPYLKSMIYFRKDVACSIEDIDEKSFMKPLWGTSMQR